MQATTVPEHVTLHGDDLQLISPRRTPASPQCTDYVYWDRRTSRELKHISHLPRKLERTIYVHQKKLNSTTILIQSLEKLRLTANMF